MINSQSLDSFKEKVKKQNVTDFQNDCNLINDLLHLQKKRNSLLSQYLKPDMLDENTDLGKRSTSSDSQTLF